MLLLPALGSRAFLFDIYPPSREPVTDGSLPFFSLNFALSL